MTKSYTLVLVPDDIPDHLLGEHVYNLLLPYWQEYEFPSYDRPCYACVADADDAMAVANHQIGDFHRAWQDFKTYNSHNPELWQAFISRWSTVALRAVVSEPDPECEECNGTGVWTSETGPNQIWDYLPTDILDVTKNSPNVWTRENRPDTVEADNIITPDGQRYGLHHGSQQIAPEVWAITKQSILDKYQRSIAVQCFLSE